MVEVVEIGLLSDIRDQSTYATFPETALRDIRSAIETVPPEVFDESEHGNEVRGFDDQVAAGLPDYEYEHAGENGRNPACKLWRNEGFEHSVDLYDPDRRIAVEIEKTERKRVSDDILKFIKGGKTQRDTRKKIKFGCIVVPTNYRGSGNIYVYTMATLRFMRGILFVDDIAVLGYRDPRWGH